MACRMPNASGSIGEVHDRAVAGLWRAQDGHPFMKR
jgi:hypothetical protein